MKNWHNINVPINNALETVAKMANLYDIFIFANQPKETLNLFIKYQIVDYFKQIIFDSHLGISKPNIRFFQYMIEKVGEEASSILYIGDRIENDILPAQKVGINTVWIDYKSEYIKIDFIPLEW